MSLIKKKIFTHTFYFFSSYVKKRKFLSKSSVILILIYLWFCGFWFFPSKILSDIVNIVQTGYLTFILILLSRILVCTSQPKCCCFSPVKPSLVFAGMIDGSIAMWDLREPTSIHRHTVVNDESYSLRYPTYDTG